MEIVHATKHGELVHGDSLEWMRAQSAGSIDLIVTSPPYALLTKKEYGNEGEEAYVEWFMPFAEEMHRILKDAGSLVLNIGGAWRRGTPTRSLYLYRLVLALCDVAGFHLAQDCYWYKPGHVPQPAVWANMRRIRLKDSAEQLYWFSKTPWPKASNWRTLQPYSRAHAALLGAQVRYQRSPSGHECTETFGRDNGGAIAANVLLASNSGSDSAYFRYLRDRGIKPHPARFPTTIPEFWIRMLTDDGDRVLDPFGGSCTTGAVCERLRRRWTCVELEEEYLPAAIARMRFLDPPPRPTESYRIAMQDHLWSDRPDGWRIPEDGGRTVPERPPTAPHPHPEPVRKRARMKTARPDLFAPAMEEDE